MIHKVMIILLVIIWNLQIVFQTVPFLRTIYIINKNDTKSEQDKCEVNYENTLIDMKKLF